MHLTYLFTLYLMLPFAWGAFCQLAASRRMIIALVLSVCIAGLNFYNYENFCVHGYTILSRPFKLFEVERRHKGWVEELKAAGVKAIYARFAEHLSYYAHREIIPVNPFSQGHAYESFMADMHLNPLFWGVKGLQGSFKLLGLEHQKIHIAGRDSAWHFKPPMGADQALDLPQARARTLDGQDLGRALTDSAALTMYSTHGPAQPGQGFVLDLGRIVEAAGFSLITNQYNDNPAGLRVEAAGEDGKFRLIREMNRYWGPFYLSGPHPVLKARHARVDCYFPLQKMRYLRLTHLGKSKAYWTAREILVYGPGKSQSPKPPWNESAEKAMELIKQKGFDLVYADTWAAAWIRVRLPGVYTIGGNTSTDSYGHDIPPINEDWMLRADERGGVVGGAQIQRPDHETPNDGGYTGKAAGPGRPGPDRVGQAPHR
jgi:hypothetical protein